MSDPLARIHPAIYSEELLDPIAGLLAGALPGRPVVGEKLLDPMAGRGHRLARIAAKVGLTPVGVEIEAGYFAAGACHPCVIQGDSTTVLWPAGTFTAATVSTPYPNGVSDDWRAAELSRRNTYAHRLREFVGRDYRMHPNNSGAANPRRSEAAYTRFMEIHFQVFARTFDALKPGAPFVVNVKAPVYRRTFISDTLALLAEVGFDARLGVAVAARGNREGANGSARVTDEILIMAKRPDITQTTKGVTQ